MTRTLRLTPALNRWRLAAWLPPLLIAVLWLFVEWLVNPTGGSPLGDDWAYALSVRAFLDHGQFYTSLPVNATLVAHTLWGALWASVFGYSIEVLRASVIALGLVGLQALYQLGREAGLRPDRAFVAVVMLGLNPFYLQLSNTFMTDVSFTAVAVVALWALVRAIRLENAWLYALALAAMLVAVFIRQLGLALPLVAAVALTVRHEWGGLYRWRLWLPSVLCFGAYLAYDGWVRAQPSLPPEYVDYSLRGWFGYLVAEPGQVLHNLLRYGGRTWVYWGLLLAPLALLRTPKRPDRLPRLTRFVDVGCGVVFGAWALAALYRGNLLTVGDNLFDFGLGPVTIAGSAQSYGQLDPLAWTVLSVVGAAGGALLLRALGYHLVSIWNHLRLMGSVRVYWVDLALVALLVLYTLPLLLRGYHDRYLLLGWIPMVILFLRATDPPAWLDRPVRTAVTVAAYLPLVWFSISGTHDYLAWNRARWNLWSELHASGITPREVDAGSDLNAYLAWPDGHSARAPMVMATDAPANCMLVTHVDWQQWLWLPPRLNSVALYERCDSLSAPQTK